MDAMAARLQAGITAAAPPWPIQVYGRIVTNPSPPCLDMLPGPVDMEIASFDDLMGAELVVVRARIATPDNEASQEVLLELMDREGDLSVADILAGDPDLDGVGNITLTARSELQPFDTADGLLLGCTWTFQVIPWFS